ncbi:hypothetical protein WMY93_033824 [Mugilogobius chulae]|uniref:Uncharacterized protein n=1 Tax=Mugilogobius chulae TaxID=88201 RepID=A0AAW0MQT0_9GOBI
MNNNAGKLFHYRITVSPPTNFLTDRPTVIEYDDHEYLFEGFSLFSHTPLTNRRRVSKSLFCVLAADLQRQRSAVACTHNGMLNVSDRRLNTILGHKEEGMEPFGTFQTRALRCALSGP